MSPKGTPGIEIRTTVSRHNVVTLTLFTIKMKNKKYHTVVTAPKSIIYMVERHNIDTRNTHVHEFMITHFPGLVQAFP